MSNYHGVLPVWKPEDWTSHDVVAKVRRLIREKRIGHTGTLDPKVVGVLPLCIGKATRIVEYLQEMPKQYEAVLRFGLSTDTEDLSGEVVERSDASHLTAEMIREAVHSFIGDIEQIPPMYSAVKVDGKRLYDLAREGKTVERKARQVTIHKIDLLDMQLGAAEPEIRFLVECSKGTYIRTLCVDIGRKLGVPSTMAKLTRTVSAGFVPSQCVTFDQIEQAVADGTFEEMLLSVEDAISDMPRIEVSEKYAHYAITGRSIPLHALQPKPLTNGTIRLYDEQGTFYGIFQVPQGQSVLRPVKVFLPNE
ncbi:tRNA pseudouridine(55) synthase TruB [Paenibacillus alvei]|uniref:tRNA pseudouridine synthase B n=1 Tax=Paenibacillus alvei TaxID=44250 RepID=A0AAP6ZVM9_PAEAL|nr:tRNA pseudouridine(55) synthase TruB [Paenibacillus alvei]MBG9733214.1 pseudouridine synthase [Paenibacillus alvei]MBG9745226.1 pseudouridine synthase [Paenibacillus alvei]MCY9580629.1 tRNA pseudouridine(55) synthase TruB [Paenibacillus alvei]MCY9585112.1 tRNA pseudouridine(55) synthase TruB [Paenibacillus alvei]NEZ43134.1 tRNA pseudouridine(55) synthase TruB [Paenibacillus alvei]